jgi:hypothetical protein
MSAGPNFIIVGAMRSGTSALAEAIHRHPQAMISVPKEPNYFATLHGALDFNGPGDQAFAEQNVGDRDSYQALFPTEPDVLGGEASAMYLALPACARDIAAQVPEAKVIIVLRDPLARARSAYSYQVARGHESAPDFAQGLALEPSRRAAGFGPIWWYRQASEYVAGIEAFSKEFPASQLLILTTEELEADPAGTMGKLYDLLGLGWSDAPLTTLLQPINTSAVPRNRVVARLVYPPDRIRSVLYNVTPDPLVGRLRQWRQRLASAPQGAEVELPAALTEQFRDIALEVEGLLGRSLRDVWPSLRPR